jgi:hypothetical protein
MVNSEENRIRAAKIISSGNEEFRDVKFPLTPLCQRGEPLSLAPLC